MSTLEVNAIDKESGSTLGLGTNGTTVDIPSGATLDVTGATVTGLSAGKVLQYVKTEGYSGSITIDNNTTPTSAGATFLVSITPTLATSKILVEFGSAYGGTDSNNQPGKAKLYRQIASGGYSSLNSESMIFIETDNTVIVPWGSSYTDSPSTTSQVDYQLYVYTGGNAEAHFAANDYYRFIRAWEIGA